VKKLYLGELGSAAARLEIPAAFDGGARLLSYVGHGGIHLWASENLFDIDSVGALDAESEQPVVLAANCLNGYFHFPYFDSLAERLVKAEGRGAIAAVAPSGLSLSYPPIGTTRPLKDPPGRHERIGDAIAAPGGLLRSGLRSSSRSLTSLESGHRFDDRPGLRKSGRARESLEPGCCEQPCRLRS
jgi:hypothetical protein